MTRPVIVGSRGSLLALSQTQQVVGSLKSLWPEREFEIRNIKTLGDRNQKASLTQIGGQGIFVKELEKALLAGKIDIAIHSSKDVPGQLSPGLELMAFPKREDARDALVTASGQTLEQLPFGACLGTGSPRRIAQLRAFRGDLYFADLRGNLDTRLKKVQAGDFDGIIVAAAGLMRLGWEDKITELLPLDMCVPMVGQGALTVEARADDEDMRSLLVRLDDRATRLAVTAERAFLQKLGGGCQLPMAANAIVDGNMLRIVGMLASEDGRHLLQADITGDAEKAAEIGVALVERLLAMGADKFIGVT